jgi:PAS domain S-box-containing protein
MSAEENTPSALTGSASESEKHAHAVEFYSDESYLLDGLSRFIGSAIGAGDAGIVIATEEHRLELARRLAGRGFDLRRAVEQGRYIALDAVETLSQFMIDDWPDEARFVQMIGSIIARAKSAAEREHGRASLFGEMVALLWAEGKFEAALRLEQLWNQVAQSHSFSLLCAYPLSKFYRQQHQDAFLRICDEHTSILPAEGYASANEDERLRLVAQWQQKALVLANEAAKNRKLHDAAAKLAAIVSSSEDAIVSKDLNGIVSSWNASAERIFGYKAEEMIGKPILMIIPPELHSDEEMILGKMRRGERIEHFETVRVTKDGRRIDVSLTISPVRDDAGKIIGAAKIARDITQQKRAHESAAKLAAIIASSEDAIVTKDLNGIVSSWNASAERIFGYKAEEMIGKPILTIIPPELHSDEEMILGKMRRGERIEHFETVRVRKDGRRIDVSLTISPVKGDAGKIIGAAKIARDITAQKRSEQAMKQVEKLAVAGRMAATMAHEINNPLEAVTNLLYLLRSYVHSEEGLRQLALAQSELDRVSHLTRQTLSFYRGAVAPERVNLSELVNSMLTVFAKKIAQKRLMIVRSEETCFIHAFRGELHQLVSNLIDNAIEATPTGGKIEISVTTREGDVLFSIADDGPGIEVDKLDQIFEPFYTTKELGTGLGLWVAREIAEKHGGRIQVESSTQPERHGSVFRVTLSANAILRPTTAADSPIKRPSGTEPYTETPAQSAD